MAKPIGIRVTGLKDFTKAAKNVDKRFGREVTKAHKDIAELMTARSQAALRSGGRQASAVAKSLRPKATQAAAILRNLANPPFAFGVIWGQRRRSGWYALKRYQESGGKQFRPWVGSQYQPGAQAGKPYYVGDAVNASVDEAIDLFGDAVDRIAKEAFPD